MVSVYNLSTGGKVAEYTCSSREAVISAYAQFEKHDRNTWNYETKYGSLVVETNLTVACGDYCTMKEGVTGEDISNELDNSFSESMMDEAFDKDFDSDPEFRDKKWRLLNDGE